MQIFTGEAAGAPPAIQQVEQAPAPARQPDLVITLPRAGPAGVKPDIETRGLPMRRGREREVVVAIR